MAALEVVKLHQLVITENKNENFLKNLNSLEALDEETIEDTVTCLLVSDNDTVEKESWMNKKTSGYRAQKATKTVRAKITQVEEFSKYLISPMRNWYDVFKRSSEKLVRKKKKMSDRITAFVRNSVSTASRRTSR